MIVVTNRGILEPNAGNYTAGPPEVKNGKSVPTGKGLQAAAENSSSPNKGMEPNPSTKE